jgi:outer membrane autotransporter protein
MYADGNAMWAKGFGGQRQQDTSGIFAGSTTTGYGGAVGYERVLNPDLKIGGLLGASANQTKLYQNAGNSSTDTVFGGAYGRFTQGGTFLDLALIGGTLDNSSARPVAGGLALQTATASYGGWFLDPAMTLGHRIEIDQRGFTITPAIKARYVAAHFDGYTETGSTANLTIGGRDFQAWEERAEVTLAKTGMIGVVSVTARVSGGIVGQQRSTAGQVNIALVGQNFLAATPDRGRVAGGYGSAGLDWQIGRATLFAAGEATYANDATRTYAGKGGVRMAW